MEAEKERRKRATDRQVAPIITEEICARAIGGRSVKSSITALTRRDTLTPRSPGEQVFEQIVRIAAATLSGANLAKRVKPVMRGERRSPRCIIITGNDRNWGYARE